MRLFSEEKISTGSERVWVTWWPNPPLVGSERVVLLLVEVN